MDFYNRYIMGQEKEVWQELLLLGNSINNPKYQKEIELILKEFRRRILFNLKLIVSKVSPIYTFKGFDYGNIPDDFDKSILGDIPFKQTNNKDKIEVFSQNYEKYGQLPLSFINFYKVIYNVDFIGEFDGWTPSFLLDEIFFDSVDSMYFANSDEPFKNNKGEYYIAFSPDPYFKHNTSGGGSYGILLNKEVMMDGNIINYGKDMYFTDYLNLCFKWLGFPSLEWENSNKIPKHIIQTILDIRKDLLPI